MHDEWRTIVSTAKTFYSNHLPYEFIYGTDINRGTIDFERRTTNLSIQISLIPTTDVWKTINDLRQGLDKARLTNETWNFNLNQIEPRRISVQLEILNGNNLVLSNATYTFNNPSEKDRVNATLNFTNVRADNITDILSVRVVSINGIPAQRAGKTGLILISSNIERNNRLAAEEAVRRERAVAEEAAKREQAAAVAAARQERTAAEEAARRERELAEAEARIQWELENPEEAQRQREEARKQQKAAEAEARWNEIATNPMYRRNIMEILSLFYQWDGEKKGLGLKLYNFYWSPIPFTSIGIEFALGGRLLFLVLLLL